jgi:signal transduction histidine kinase
MISYFYFRLGCGALRVLVHVQLEELARVNRIIDELLFLSRADAHAITVDLKQQVPAAFLNTFAQDATALAEHHGRRFSYQHQGEGPAVFEETHATGPAQPSCERTERVSSREQHHAAF